MPPNLESQLPPMTTEVIVLIAALAAAAIYAAFRARAEARIQRQEEAEFSAAVQANQGLEHTRRQIDRLASRSPELLFVIAGIGVFAARSLDVPWLGALAAAAAYFMLARVAIRRVQRTASRAAALLLVVLACGLAAIILLQAPDWLNRRSEWRYAVYVALFAMAPALPAIKLTFRHHRLRGARPR